MGKFFLIILVCLISSANNIVLGQKRSECKHCIVYSLPRNVESSIADYIKSNSVVKANNYAILLSKTTPTTYKAFILKCEKDNENMKLIYDNLITISSRMIETKDVGFLPVLFDEDFVFATFESIKFSNGKIGKRNFVFNHDSYFVEFDQYGKIIMK